jgi:hypothetical protein
MSEIQYCYSLNQEEFFHAGTSEEEAHLAAMEALDEDEGRDGCVPGAIYWIGTAEPPRFSINRIGETLYEMLQDDLFDEVGEVADRFTLTAEQITELGQVVLSKIEEWGGFKVFRADNIVQHEVPGAIAYD